MKGLKLFVVFSFLLSLASLAGIGILYQRLQEAEALKEKLESNQVQLEQRSAQLESQANQSAKFQQEVERLREQMKSYVSQRDAAKKEVEQVFKDMSVLRKQIKALEAEKGILTEEMTIGEETEKAIVREAAKVPITPPTAALAVAPTERPHQVLSVNRQFQFVVVNVGLRNRLKIGDTLRVEEGGKLIGRIQVEKLYETFSACRILEENEPSKIKEGDLVRVV